MLMPFGKYKGYSISSLPLDYIDYLLENYELRIGLKYELTNELNRREKLLDLSESRIKKVYRQMSLKYHPDAGGSDQAMQAINDFYQTLKNQ